MPFAITPAAAQSNLSAAGDFVQFRGGGVNVGDRRTSIVDIVGPNLTAARGWGLHAHVVTISRIAPPTDAFFDNTILLLRGQGEPGGSVITDQSNPVPPYLGNWNPPDGVVGVTTGDDYALAGFGTTSLKFSGAVAGLSWTSLAAQAYLGNSITSGVTNTKIWTMEAWVRKASASSMGIMSYRPPAAIGWAFTTGGWRASIGGAWSDTWISVAEPSVGVWSHRALVRNGANWYYWADGSLAGSFANNNNIDANAAEFLVGRSGGGGEQAFLGNMYVRFTIDVARYTAPFAPPLNFQAS